MVLLQTATGTPSTGAVTATFTNPTRPGSLVLAFQGHTTNGDTPAIPTDNAGNTWTSAYAGNINSINNCRYAPNAKSLTSVTITPSSSNSTHALIIREYGGIDQQTGLDRAKSGNGTANSLTTGASTATRDANELLVVSAVFTGNNPVTLAAGSGFGNLTTSDFGGSTTVIFGVEDQLVSSAGAQTGTMTGTNANINGWDIGLAAFFLDYGLILGRNIQVGDGMSRNDKAY